jgi:hypothetical protein
MNAVAFNAGCCVRSWQSHPLMGTSNANLRRSIFNPAVSLLACVNHVPKGASSTFLVDIE